MTIKYAKLINKTTIQFPPKNKEGIINYNLNVDLMLQDGYKPFIKVEIPETNRVYHIEYIENTNNIQEVIVYNETQEEADERELKQAKQSKYNEANSKAKNYLESGEACFVFTQGENDYHIEATDGNIAKIGLKATALLIAQDFETTFPWNTKEDINIEINALEGKAIAEGLGLIQDSVWTLQFPAYITQIENAQTINEVNSIEISYLERGENV